MKKIFTIIFSLHLSSFSFSATVYFTPSKDCENAIIKNINQSTKSIDAAVYSINNSNIVQALIEAHKRKLKIRILTDAVQAAGPSSKILNLINSGVNLKVHSVHKIMHNKFALFDNKNAMNGSYNWTNPASDKNSENCVFFSQNEANIISAYKNEFEHLWEINSDQKSSKKISSIIEKKSKRSLATEND